MEIRIMLHMQILHSGIYEIPGRELFCTEPIWNEYITLMLLWIKLLSLHALWENQLNGKEGRVAQVATPFLNDITW